MPVEPYCRIPLCAKDGSVRAHALVDASDHAQLARHRWRLQEHGYAVRHEYIDHTHSRSIRMHRQIMGVTDPETHIDHINGDKLDNRRTNLRVATRSQNEQNRSGLNQNNRSGHRGVHWSKSEQKWKVQVTLDRKVHCLGTFDDLEEAARSASAFRAEHMPFAADARMAA